MGNIIETCAADMRCVEEAPWLRESPQHNPTVTIVINKKLHRITIGQDGVTPTTVLTDWLAKNSTTAGLHPRRSCGTGYCGACVCVLTYLDPGTKQKVNKVVNTCLRTVASCNGMAITTTEGIEREHPIKKALVDNAGSQCGFCSPGMVMNLYGTLMKNEGASLSTSDAEQLLDGNICRCTGYSPIAETYKAVIRSAQGGEKAGKPPSEPGNSCCGRKMKQWQPPEVEALPKFVDPCLPEAVLPVCVKHEGVVWYEATSEAELKRVLRFLPLWAPGAEPMLVAGNTSNGLQRFYGPWQSKVYINIAGIKDLRGCSEADGSGVCIGSLASLGDAVDFFEALAKQAPGSAAHAYAMIAEAGRRSPGGPVRDAATVGGNVMLTYAHQEDGKHFPYEWPMLFEALDCTVTVVDPRYGSEAALTFPEFYRQRSMSFKYIKCFHIPCPQDGTVFRAYSARQRSRYAEAYASAALACAVQAGRVVPGSARLVFNGIASRPLRLRRVEQLMDGHRVANATVEVPVDLQEALAEAIAQEKRSSAYGEKPENEFGGLKESLCAGYLQKYWLSLIPTEKQGRFQMAEKPYLKDETTHFDFRYPQEPEDKCLRQPVKKIDALDQANATATYVGDIPVPSGTVFGCPVYAERMGRFEDLSLTAWDKAAEIEGFVDLLCARRNGDFLTNVPSHDEDGWQFVDKRKADECKLPTLPIFAVGDEGPRYLGHHMGIALGKTPEAARRCARAAQAHIQWSPCDTRKAVVDLLEAMKDPCRIVTFTEDDEVTCKLARKYNANIWDCETGHWEELLPDESNKVWHSSPQRQEGRRLIGGQYHYALEPITALAEPQDSWSAPHMVVQASTRAPHNLALALWQVFHRSTQWTQGDVEVRVRRCGGAFGCKTNNTQPIAIEATLGALFTRGPVRVMADLDEQMRHNCGRPSYVFDFQVGFDDTGKITIVRGTIYLGVGFIPGPEPTLYPKWILHDSLDGCYFIENWDVDCKVVLTDTPMAQAMRAPGDLLACTFMENAVIDAVARELSKDPFDVRQRNWYRKAELCRRPLISPGGMDISDIDITKVMVHLHKRTDYDERKREVEAFNRGSRWVKKGLALVVHRYPVYSDWKGNQYFDTFLRIGRDGEVQVRTGSVEQGQGSFTKIAQTVVDHLFGKLGYQEMTIDNISFGRLDTTVSNASPDYDSGSSVTCEYACWSAEKACKEMVHRLQDMEHRDYQGVEPAKTWRELIGRALEKQVTLDCHVYTEGLGDVKPIQYNNTSATLTEVSVDGLTGQVEIVRCDLYMDMGKSMNPLVDMGQIQGAFVMGAGHALCEKQNRAEEDQEGQIDWFDYHPPTPWEGPKKWHIEIDASRANEAFASMGNKSVGETGVVLGQTSVHSAVQQAIYEIQKENELPFLRSSPVVPMTVNIRQGLCRPKGQQMPSIIDECDSHKMPDRTQEDSRRKTEIRPRHAAAPKRVQLARASAAARTLLQQQGTAAASTTRAAPAAVTAAAAPSTAAAPTKALPAAGTTGSKARARQSKKWFGGR